MGKWLDRNEYPFTSRYFNYHGVSQHYVDEGTGQVVLFLHGTPTWSFDFRHQVAALRTDFRCIAPDLVGFGLSEKPREYDYRIQHHVERLEQFVQTLDLHQIHLVVHDFGGPIGLAFAQKHPERIASITLFNTWMWDASAEPEYQRLKKVLQSPLLPILYTWFNFSPRYLLPKSYGSTPLSKKLHGQYMQPFASKRERKGPVAFAYSLLHDQGWFGSLWNNQQSLSHLPVLLIWGMNDSFIGPAGLGKFKQVWPAAETLELKGVGHFPQDEAGERVTKKLHAFLKRH